jgi:hypothetical protein
MKKIKLILLMGIMSGCSYNRTLVRLSDISVGEVKTEKVTKLYISNGGYGPSLYRTWESGIYGKNIAVLIDSVKFNELYNKSKPVDNTKDFISLK